MADYKGVAVTTETTIDWWELGRDFASEADNEQQALFLHGASVGFGEIGSGKGAIQLASIRAAIVALDPVYRDDVFHLLDDLTPDE